MLRAKWVGCTCDTLASIAEPAARAAETFRSGWKLGGGEAIEYTATLIAFRPRTDAISIASFRFVSLDLMPVAPS